MDLRQINADLTKTGFSSSIVNEGKRLNSHVMSANTTEPSRDDKISLWRESIDGAGRCDV